MTLRALLGAALAALLLAGCDGGGEQAAAAPDPVEVTAEATGHYCGMLLQDHAGPKGQIHLASRAEPVWFSSVRDTVAFTRLPEEPDDITAIYVNDMARAGDWDSPAAGTWIEARGAWFVIGSRQRGGMGAPEAVPFGAEAEARTFAEENGGRVVRLAEIPDDYVLGEVQLGEEPASGHPAPAHEDQAGDTGHSSH